MIQWKARSQTTMRGDIGGSVHVWSRTTASVSRDQRRQSIVRMTRAVHAGQRPPQTRDQDHAAIAHRSSNGARSQVVHPPGDLVVEAQHEGETVTVVLAGEFDLVTADAVRTALTRAIGESQGRLVVDLRRVSFIDSSGLHVLLEAYMLCRDADPALTIRPGPPNVQRVFELAHLLNYLPFDIDG